MICGPPALPGPRSWSLGNWILVCSPCCAGRLQTEYRQRGCNRVRGVGAQGAPPTPSGPGKTVNCRSEESSEISKKKVPPRGTASVSYSLAVR